MLQGERRAPDPGGPGLDRHDLPVERLGAVGDPGLGQDQAFGAVGAQRDRLPGDVGPVADSGDLAVGQIDGVVDVAHRVGVGEADGDIHAMAKRPGQVARIRPRSGRVGVGRRVVIHRRSVRALTVKGLVAAPHLRQTHADG